MEKMPQILPETDFDDSMDREVIPYLTSICKCGYLPVEESRGDDGRLYYETYCPADARGAIVISHGFCETIEKYKEVIYYFTKMGLKSFVYVIMPANCFLLCVQSVFGTYSLKKSP